MTDANDLNGETVKLLRQLAEDIEAGRIHVLTVKFDDSWQDDPRRGKPHKILASRTWSISAGIVPSPPPVTSRAVPRLKITENEPCPIWVISLFCSNRV